MIVFQLHFAGHLGMLYKNKCTFNNFILLKYGLKIFSNKTKYNVLKYT